MNQIFADTNNNTNIDILQDAVKKFNTIRPKICNEFFELDIFSSRIITTQQVSSPLSTSPHKHSFYELFIPISGTSTYKFKKTTLNLFQNKICLIIPHTMHQLVKFSDDFAALTFGFYFLAPTTLSLPIHTDKEYFELINSPYIINSIMYILNLAQEAENGYYQRINMQLSLLIFDVINQIEPMRRAFPYMDNNEEKSETITDDTRIRAAIQYISDNIASDILVDDVAASAGVCSRQLNRILNSSINISTNELINKIRIKTAKKYMESPSLTLSQISTKCGFNSLTSFSRTFKKITGVAPKYYKQNEDTTCQTKSDN